MKMNDEHYTEIGIDMAKFYKKGFNNTLTQRDINNSIIDGELSYIKTLIKCGLSIYLLDKSNINASHITTLEFVLEDYVYTKKNNVNIKEYKYETMKFLLDNGAMTDFIGGEDDTYYCEEEMDCYDYSIFGYLIDEDKTTKLLDLVLYGNYNINVNLNKRWYNTLMKLIRYDYDINYMRKVINMNLNINYYDLNGNNALMIAIKYFRNIDVLSLLVESGINIHKINEDGENALLMALTMDFNYRVFETNINKRQKQMINYLIECGADVYETLFLLWDYDYPIESNKQYKIIKFLLNKLNKDKLNAYFEGYNNNRSIFKLRSHKGFTTLYKSMGLVHKLVHNSINREIYMESIIDYINIYNNK
jgi:hypothetical protein